MSEDDIADIKRRLTHELADAIQTHTHEYRVVNLIEELIQLHVDEAMKAVARKR